jgi:hypothetical protein
MRRKLFRTYAATSSALLANSRSHRKSYPDQQNPWAPADDRASETGDRKPHVHESTLLDAPRPTCVENVVRQDGKIVVKIGVK